MTKNLATDLNIYAPLEQALRCLETWLKEESRAMDRKGKHRTAALLARYFQYEDDVTDDLILSFLRHYSGRKEIDIEDPTSVRMEIKSLLDRSKPAPGLSVKSLVSQFILPTAAGLCLGSAAFLAWAFVQRPITPEQQMALKEKVAEIAALDQRLTPNAVWAEVKKPLDVTSYHEISWWHYDDAQEKLDQWLLDLKENRLAAGPGM